MVQFSTRAEKMIDRKGEEATLTEFTHDGTDEQGDPTYTESTSTVNVILSVGTTTRTPERLDTAIGESRPMDFEFFIKADDAPASAGITGKSPEITFRGEEYRVVEVEHYDQHLGIRRLISESLRTGS